MDRGSNMVGEGGVGRAPYTLQRNMYDWAGAVVQKLLQNVALGLQILASGLESLALLHFYFSCLRPLVFAFNSHHFVENLG